MTAGRWLLRRPGSDVSQRRVICIPHAGSGASAYAGWAAAAPPDCELVLARLPGRESRIAEPPYVRAQEAADGLLDALTGLLDRPYAIFGYSMGALIAYELTRRIAAADLVVPRLLAVGGAEAPHLPRRDGGMHRLPRSEFVECMRALGGTPEAVFDSPELLDLVIPTVRADLRLVETYRHVAGPLLPVPIVTHSGADDPELTIDGVRAWGELTAAGAEHVVHPGAHFFIAPSGDPVLPAIVASTALRTD